MPKLNPTAPRVLNLNADPVAEGTIEVTIAGTDTPVTLYSDPALSTSLGTSATADANGYFPELYVAAGVYDVIYKDADGALITEIEDVVVLTSNNSVEFDDVDDLKADQRFTYANGAAFAGAIWRTQKEGYAYEVLAEGATGQNLTTPGGVKLAIVGRLASALDVIAFGAKPDGVRLSDGAMTASDATLTSATAAFTSADVGKLIQVSGAGASGASLITTIASINSATSVELAAAATTTVSGENFRYGTDSAEAFKAAFTAAVATKHQPGFSGNDVIGVSILVPGGDGFYMVGSARCMMDTTSEGRAAGLTWRGTATGTSIYFAVDADNYLFYNDNEFLKVTIRDLQFECDSDTSKFWFSTANGGAQNIELENVEWLGIWQKLYVLRGANNNSEWSWINCGLTASIRDVALDIQDSDQFLNYSFVNCKLWLFDGQMLRATRGGHFKFINTDFSGLEPGMTLNTSSNGAPLFELLNNDHARGVCHFYMAGCRFEQKNTNSKMIYCEWNRGVVQFVNNDVESNLPTGIETTEQAVFSCGNTDGPQVIWDGCTLIGEHHYDSGSSSWTEQRNASYRNCTIFQDTPDDFLFFSTPTNLGGRWLVDLRNCRNNAGNATNGEFVVWDFAYNARYAMGGSGRHGVATFRNSAGQGTPTGSGTLSMTLPDQALVTRVAFHSTGVLTSVASVDFEVASGATVVANSGTQTLGDAFTVSEAVSYAVTGNPELVLSDGNTAADQSSGQVWVTVEFLA